MSRVLFLFLDGVGLGPPDPAVNPLAAADMPHLIRLLGGRRLLAGSAPFWGPEATLLEIDARLGMPDTPQSATGQAALLTGRNVSRDVGQHYGPKPNQPVAEILRQDNVFKRLRALGRPAALLNAYPPGYFQSITSGRRLYSAIPLAVTSAGFALMTAEDLAAGRALSADFTGAGWAAQPNFPKAHVYTPDEAGQQLAALSQAYDLSWFDYWASDYAGHHQDAPAAIGLLESLDGVLGGLVGAWSGRDDLIVLTSDHGNMEDLGVRGHTLNPVPGLLIGPERLRRRFARQLHDLTDFAPAVLDIILGSGAEPDSSPPIKRDVP